MRLPGVEFGETHRPTGCCSQISPGQRKQPTMAGTPAAVYLDQLHWVSLARASIGHARGARYVDVLNYLRQSVPVRKAVFPLSATHYEDLHGDRNYRQRIDVASIMCSSPATRPSLASARFDAPNWSMRSMTGSGFRHNQPPSSPLDGACILRPVSQPIHVILTSAFLLD